MEMNETQLFAINTTNSTDILATPIQPAIITLEFWILYIIFYMSFSVISWTENITILTTIILDKKLHSFFFVLIAGQSSGQILLGIGHFMTALSRLIPAYYPSWSIMSRLECHSINILVYVMPSYICLSMLILALDRTYAVTLPMKYQKRSAKQGLLVVVGVYLIAILIKVVPSYPVPESFPKIVTCATSKNAVTNEWWQYNYYANGGLVVTSVLLYSMLLVIAIKRKNSLKNGTFSNDDLSNRMLKRQLKLLDNIRLLIVIYGFTYVPYTILLNMSNYFVAPTSSRMVVYGASLEAIGIVIEPMALLLTANDINRCVKERFSVISGYVKGNTITNISLGNNKTNGSAL